MDKKFQLIINHEDKHSSNLNQIFESYGCDTLEAKVPTIEDPTFEKMKTISPEQQLYATLALKTEAAKMAVKNRAPRTSNKTLKVVEIAGQTMLAMGQERERSPVDRGELDDELEAYMRERARLKAQNTSGIKEPIAETITPAPSVARELVSKKISLQKPIREEVKGRKHDNKENEIMPDADTLNADLEEYMREASRLKAQRKLAQQQSERDIVMDYEGNWEIKPQDADKFQF